MNHERLTTDRPFMIHDLTPYPYRNGGVVSGARR